VTSATVHHSIDEDRDVRRDHPQQVLVVFGEAAARVSTLALLVDRLPAGSWSV
jgi:hypothetical protein